MKLSIMTRHDVTVAQPTVRARLNKVPEITLWFWIIKILCTTVGESFADWINMTLGVGLGKTSIIFTFVLGAILVWQFKLSRYNAFAYWSTVVVVSVTGTLYTDILTDNIGVPLALSTSIFAVALAIVFGVWYFRERTLSIHSIVTVPREAFYWLAILVTFALGTAAGDWTLELTGWGPGTSVLLPAGLIVAVLVGWRFGASPVLAFWLAYILTRPLGANLGDWFASPSVDHGLGLGTAWTSVIFLGAILATVVYLTVTKADVIEDRSHTRVRTRGTRERMALGYFAVIATVAAGLLVWAHGQPHVQASSEGESGPVSNVHLAPAEATAHFPTAEIVRFRTITQDTLDKLKAGDEAGANARITDLETAWDGDQGTLLPVNNAGWHFLDGQVDTVLTAIRNSSPNLADEESALEALLTSLG